MRKRRASKPCSVAPKRSPSHPIPSQVAKVLSQNRPQRCCPPSRPRPPPPRQQSNHPTRRSRKVCSLSVTARCAHTICLSTVHATSHWRARARGSGRASGSSVGGPEAAQAAVAGALLSEESAQARRLATQQLCAAPNVGWLPDGFTPGRARRRQAVHGHAGAGSSEPNRLCAAGAV